MKQNLSAARKSSRYIIAIVTVLLACSSGCATLPNASYTHDSAVPASSNHANRLNINTATEAQLETLPGVGKVIAERIVEHRERFGPFRRAEHLMMVRGISERKFLELRPLIVAE